MEAAAAMRAVPEGPRHLDHPAFLYANREDFLGTLAPFVTAGIENRDVVFVAARGDYLEPLQHRLGERAGAARWVDTEEWHPHPASRLRALHELVTAELEAGALSLRLVGEPVWPSGPPEFVREWQRYESALNSVLGPFRVTLLCLYDASLLQPAVLEGALRTHRVVVRAGREHPSAEFREPEDLLPRLNLRLSPPPPSAVRLLDVADLALGRRFFTERVRAAGVAPGRAMDLAIAANEILTNVLVHAEGAATVWSWTEDRRLICQIEDQGPGIGDPLAGYRPPGKGPTGRGLWLARQLVDLLQIDTSPSGTKVRLHLNRA
jgi:anti-sigma regulatory factor (Ser/Thr protein kinase)